MRIDSRENGIMRKLRFIGKCFKAFNECLLDSLLKMPIYPLSLFNSQSWFALPSRVIGSHERHKNNREYFKVSPYEEAPPERGTLSKLQVYERVWVSLVEVP